jgi:hypothetical protein
MAHGVALHQRAGHCGQGRFKQDAGVLRVALPGAKVFHKLAGVVRVAGHLGQWAQMRQVVLYACGERGYFCGTEHAAQHHGTVTLVVGHGVCGECEAVCHTGTHSVGRSLRPRSTWATEPSRTSRVAWAMSGAR